jgi:hypothetical protein
MQKNHSYLECKKNVIVYAENWEKSTSGISTIFANFLQKWRFSWKPRQG